MTLKQNTAEGGTNGTTITTGNSGGGSGDAFNAITINSGTFVFDNSQVMHGGLSLKIGTAASNTTFFDWTGYTATTMTVRGYLRMSSLPSLAGFRLIDVRDSAGNGVGRVNLSASNKLVFQNNGSTLYTSTASFTATTWYRLELVCCNNTGKYAFDWYVGDSLTPVETGFLNAAQSSGTTNTIAVVRWGNSASNSFVGSEWYDDVAANDGVTTYIGPAASGATVTGVAATASALFQAPAITGETIISGGSAATASALMPAPVVTAVRAPTVTGVAATASALMPAPVVTGVRSPTVVAVAATGSALAVPPTTTTTRSPTVTGVAAVATAAMGVPFVQGGGAVNVAAVAMTATETLPAPVVTGQKHVTVVAVAATESGLMTVPSLSGGAGVIAVRGIASGAAYAPSVPGSISGNVLAVAAGATLLLKAPAVAAYVPRDVEFKVNDPVAGHPFSAKLSN